MILADTSVWVDHLRKGEAELAGLLGENSILIHPLVIGELACGNLPRRIETLDELRSLPTAPLASHDEVVDFITAERLHDIGIGIVDAHLLASTRLAGAKLWSKDKALCRAASRLRLLA